MKRIHALVAAVALLDVGGWACPAPAAAALLLAGVVLKTGAYGLLRFSVPMFPDAMWKFRSLLVGLSLSA